LLTLVIAVLLFACYPRYSPGVRYFAWTNFYLEPPIPTQPITRERAEELVRQGYSYYVGDYDQKGLRRLREVKADGKILVLWDAAGPDGGR
jgi:hypothetical protein